MLPTKIILVDNQASLVSAWKNAFDEVEAVEVARDDFFSRPADAMVSPANSFAIMDGGLDRAIRDRLGFEVARSAQKRVVEDHHGELPVGQALIVETAHAEWPHLIVAPTMRVPENVARTLNAYAAFRAVLLAVSRFNQTNAARIGSIVCPGLCTGIGGMDATRCAVQMRMAYAQMVGPARTPSFDRIHAIHRALTQS